MSPPYSYVPSSNSDLIEQLHLQKHPEGGYYAETDRQSENVPSPFAGGEARSLATSIYYLLTPDSPTGFIHMNKSVTYHVLHHGRSEYTLIHPTSPPRIETITMGTDTAAGEKRLLIVGTGVWKMSRLPEGDLSAATSGTERERVGCLITEVVVPGFHWEDHKYMTLEQLKELFRSTPGGEDAVERFKRYIKST